MFIEKDFGAIIIVFLITLLILVATIMIPMFGYKRKRWKGLALGCLLQPVVFLILASIFIGSVVGYEIHKRNQQKESAMVTVRTTEPGAYGIDTITWYVKADDECIIECKQWKKNEYDKNDSLMTDIYYKKFDVFRLDSDSNAVCVEDRVVVRFDLKHRKATATDYGKPAEVINVDWDKAKAYLLDKR